MTPWHKEKMIVESAQWMWWSQKKNDPAIWWVPSDLTQDNPDTSCPQLSLDDAQTVFEELKSRGLLRIDRATFFRKRASGEEEHKMVVFFIQRHKEKAWLNLIGKGFFGIYVAPLFRGARAVTLSIFLFVAAAVMGSFFSSFGGDLYTLLKRIVKAVIE